MRKRKVYAWNERVRGWWIMRVGGDGTTDVTLLVFSLSPAFAASLFRKPHCAATDVCNL